MIQGYRMTIKKAPPLSELRALLARTGDIPHSRWPEPSRKIMHVPISHATLQCSATPSASMHPRPNPSFLSMVASRRCLGALSKGMGGGSQKKKGSQRGRKTERQ